MTAKPAILDHASTLADVTRCRLLLVLDHHELTVSELRQVLQLPQSTVSRHLKVLADDGWLSSRRDGTSHLYRLLEDDDLAPAAADLWRLVRREAAETPASRQDRSRLESVLASRRSRSQAFFSSAAGTWDETRDDLFGPRFDLLALLALLDPEWTVGDLACGTGRLSAALAPFVRQVVAVDASSAMLETARGRLESLDTVSVRAGELEDLPLRDGELDAAVIVLALHHVNDPEKVLHEARRVLAPGGRLLVVDMLPHDREEYRQEMGHLWLGFGEDQMLRFLDAADFKSAAFRRLPADPESTGPGLFAAIAHLEGAAHLEGTARRGEDAS